MTGTRKKTVNRSLAKRLLDKPYFLWSALFIIAPLIMVAFYAFTDKSGAFSLNSFSQIIDYLPTILLSILYGLVATVICIILGYPFAYFLSKHTKRTQRTIVLLVMLPMWMNFLIRTYSLMTILGDTGVLNGLFSALGLLKTVDGEAVPLHMINTSGAVILGMV
ncbi:MAG: ABC transporter permease, partial [Eubacterium sp.]|nr:ABC transporter permease [Eubacterium sp.]